MLVSERFQEASIRINGTYALIKNALTSATISYATQQMHEFEN